MKGIRIAIGTILFSCFLNAGVVHKDFCTIDNPSKNETTKINNQFIQKVEEIYKKKNLTFNESECSKLLPQGISYNKGLNKAACLYLDLENKMNELSYDEVYQLINLPYCIVK